MKYIISSHYLNITQDFHEKMKKTKAVDIYLTGNLKSVLFVLNIKFMWVFIKYLSRGDHKYIKFAVGII